LSGSGSEVVKMSDVEVCQFAYEGKLGELKYKTVDERSLLAKVDQVYVCKYMTTFIFLHPLYLMLFEGDLLHLNRFVRK
jgi:hypothetical protein